VPASDGSQARVAGYIRPLEDREIDAPWLVMAGDFFPPSAFRRVAPPAGGVSVDYTIHLHYAAADPGPWLAGVFICRDNAGGIALEHGTLSTPGGAIVAETFQTRWTG
jgi:Thioesterase-like superfamily